MKKRIILSLAALMTLLQCSDSGFEYDNPWDPKARNYNHGSFTLTIDASVGGSVSPLVGTYSYNEEKLVIVTASADSGYRFTGWSGTVSETTNPVTITMDANKTLRANFQQTFVDSRDGRSYRKVTIGTQTWMGENLNYDVPDVTSDVCYNNSADSCAKYGRLYNWTTAMMASNNSSYWGGSDVNHTGVCPAGWHIPSDAEWTTLTDFVGSNAGTKLKSSTGWNNIGVPVGTDQYGFAALPGGSGISGDRVGLSGYWWSATEGYLSWNAGEGRYTSPAWLRSMDGYNEDVFRRDYSKGNLFSVRCVQDDPTYMITFDATGGSVSPASGTTGEGYKLALLPTPKRTCYTFNGWYTSAAGGEAVTVNTVFSSDVTVYALWTVISGCTAFTDSRDGQEYGRVVIGEQTWMGENLNYDVPNVTSDVCYDNDNDTSNCAQYGRLYNWSTAMNGASSSSLSPSGVQGVCPVGWHIPSDAEWTTLVDYVDYPAGTKLKSSQYWEYYGPSYTGTDVYGFAALPGGYGSGGYFHDAGSSGYWWSTTWGIGNFRIMNYNNEIVGRNNYDYGYYSVRCVEDAGIQMPTTYTLTIAANPSAGGTVSPSVGAHTYGAGTSVTVTATANSGYTFTNWSGDSTSTSSTIKITMDGDKTLTANFQQRAVATTQYTVSFNANGGSGTAPSAQTVNAGYVIMLPNGDGLTRSGYTFGGWNADSSGTGTNYSKGSSYTVNGNVTLFAMWDWVGKGNDINNYKTVTIGTQTWMAENLDYYVEGSKCYGNSADSCAKYGRLYNWATAMGGASSSSASPSGVQGVCPVGWHIPSDAEWTALTDFVGGASTAGTKLKSTSGWYNNGNGTDNYDFSALPGGYGGSAGDFYGAGHLGNWWSATEINAFNFWGRTMLYNGGNVARDIGHEPGLFSVRCVQD